jgi:hypothetical protein
MKETSLSFSGEVGGQQKPFPAGVASSLALLPPEENAGKGILPHLFCLSGGPENL